MPGLIRGVARTAVIAGTATAVSNGVSRRQVSRWDKKAQEQQAEQQAQQPAAAPQPAAPQAAAPAPQAAPDDMTAKVEQLKQLADLKDQGILTEEEFAAQKAKILG